MFEALNNETLQAGTGQVNEDTLYFTVAVGTWHPCPPRTPLIGYSPEPHGRACGLQMCLAGWPCVHSHSNGNERAARREQDAGNQPSLRDLLRLPPANSALLPSRRCSRGAVRLGRSRGLEVRGIMRPDFLDSHAHGIGPLDDILSAERRLRSSGSNLGS